MITVPTDIKIRLGKDQRQKHLSRYKGACNNQAFAKTMKYLQTPCQCSTFLVAIMYS
jgi:hypothetical protein